jgi:hypothetical protein
LSLNGIPLRKNARAGVASSLRGRVQVKGGFSPKKTDLKRISSGGNISKNHLRCKFYEILFRTIQFLF